VARAQLETQLEAAVDRTAPELRSCAGPMLPARLDWMKGAVAWELDVPLDDVRIVRTPGTAGYLARLSDPDNRPLPWLTDSRSVTVTRPARGAAFLDPFGDARVTAPGAERILAADGRWRVVELARKGACRA
jgi:hypothetical protein